MSTIPLCQCGSSGPVGSTNAPGLSQIAYRVGDFNSFRAALLTPLMNPDGTPAEVALNAWTASQGSDPAVPDLGVMMAEWWAYIGDVLSFYNERIANEDYLGTAMLPDTPAGLVAILGYRPRPTIGATGTLAALVSPSVLPGQTVTLPKGLQFQSKPGPGQTPQTYELSQATAIGLPDQVSTLPPPNLIVTSQVWKSYLIDEFEDFARMEPRIFVTPGKGWGEVGWGTWVTVYSVLLKGTISKVNVGNVLLLGPLDDTVSPSLMTVYSAPEVQQTANGKQTNLTMTATSAPPAMTAENAQLTRAAQSAALWSVNGSAVNSAGTVVQLAGLARQIEPNDWVVFSVPSSGTSELVQVTAVQDMMGDASSAGGPTPASPPASGGPTPIPVLHTQLTLSNGLTSAVTGALNQTSLLYDWVSVGTLIDQPPALWDGVSTELYPIQPAQLSTGAPQQILLADSVGNGQLTSGVTAGDGGLDVTWPLSTPTPLSPEMQPPITVYYNLLPVSCGKTVTNEILGSGDATQAGQSFKLAKSPVTYLTSGASFQSTVTITVDALPWTEVASFYGQPANAQVFVTREDAQQNTWVDFGDGVNGARLTTGVNNVIANYRVGGGSQIPAAGKLTVIAQNYPGLQAIANPVVVSGGSDPDPASLIKEYAPRSVLAFGRAVSVFDYAAIAAQASGATMASASWAWDAADDRATVTVYVAGQPNIAATVQKQLAIASDPNRPVTVLEATPVPVTFALNYVVQAGSDTNAINAALTTALTDPEVGLFSPAYLQIGVGLFNSQIEAVCLGVSGVLAIASSQFIYNGSVDPGPIHLPGEGAYFTLDPSNFNPSAQAGTS
ncbi:MAG TPA: hypothetical protein VL986_03975 [Terracidiphilus sp.]|nr:hypothetical protein [Terracidiphilus sp.]